MKRCPTCQKTFDDAMRFCQADGTPLVEETKPADPYKTMVASKEDIQAALSSQPVAEPEKAGIRAPEEEPLELPSSTRGSEAETKIAGHEEPQVIDIPPLAESAEPEPPAFNEPSVPRPAFGESAPPSPFSKPEPASGPGDFPTTPPIPSPFGGSKPASFEPPPAPKVSEPELEEPTYFEPESPGPPSYSEPEPVASKPPFAEPERPAAPAFNPFEAQAEAPKQPIAQSEWTPPPAPSSGGPGQFRPPAATGAKVNQTLPIVSLVFGILSLCCYVSPLTGIIALITGFLGMKNANNNPAQYGGKTLAIVGMVLGGLMFLVGIAYYIFFLFFGGLGMMMQMLNQT